MHLRSSDGYKLDNERLEFLGDAVLGAVSGSILYNRYRKVGEGTLTTLRSNMVKRETLNEVAVKIGLDKLLVIPRSFEIHGDNIYGNAFEALIGAIYQDQGYGRCEWFMERLIDHRVIDLDELAHSDTNYKSKLIEWGQKHKVEVVFELLNASSENGHYDTIFETEVRLCGLVAGRGQGKQKKISQQKAAHNALKRLKEKAFMGKVLEAAAVMAEANAGKEAEAQPQGQDEQNS